MLKSTILTVLLLLASNQAVAFDHQYVAESVTYRLQHGDERGLAAEALEKALNFAAVALKEKGYAADAEKILVDWNASYVFYVAGVMDDTGDHDPVSDWLAAVYAVLTVDLGDSFVESTHLKDIWVLNFVMPVVFHPVAAEKWCTDQLVSYPLDTCQAEYRRHFAGTKYAGSDPYATDDHLHHGFSGVVTYWIVWGACEGATYGTGWFVICSPAGNISETLVEKFIAEKASDKIWARHNPAALGSPGGDTEDREYEALPLGSIDE